MLDANSWPWQAVGVSCVQFLACSWRVPGLPFWCQENPNGPTQRTEGSRWQRCPGIMVLGKNWEHLSVYISKPRWNICKDERQRKTSKDQLHWSNKSAICSLVATSDMAWRHVSFIHQTPRSNSGQWLPSAGGSSIFKNHSSGLEM
jgi:hypothetical protein